MTEELKIISKEEAKLYGSKFYFTGRPCTNGHFSERYISGSCVECNKYRSKARYYIHRDKIIKQHRVYYLSSCNEKREARILSVAKSRAKKKNIEFSITLSDIYIPDTCPIFGMPFAQLDGLGTKPNSPSLDRIDSSKGYVPGNVWVISWKANSLKRDATLAELEALVCGLRKKMLE